MIKITQKRIPVSYLNTIIDDIFNDTIFGYNPSDLISTFFNANQITVDSNPYPIMDQHLLQDGSILYKFAVSSFDKDEIETEISNNELIVRCTKDKNKKNKWTIAKTLVKRISEKDFEFRSFISEKMDINKIECNIYNGELSIMIPLKEEMKPISKKLEIK